MVDWAFSTELLEGMQTALQNIAIEQRNIARQIIQVSRKTLTPSSGCLSQNAERDFLPLVQNLGLASTSSLGLIVTTGTSSFRSKEWKDLDFTWCKSLETLQSISIPQKPTIEDKVLEKTSYEAVCRYVNELINEEAVVVADGQHLAYSTLFREDIYTLQPRIYVSGDELVKNLQPLQLITEVKGRTDIIVVDMNDVPHIELEIFSRYNVIFAIEIKTIEGFSNDDACLRECCLQLIGLCAGNHKKTPSVLTTNLQEKHYVLSLSHGENPGSSLRFSLHITKFETFKGAIDHAYSMSQRPCFTSVFARPPTPRASISVEDDSDYD